MECIFCKIVKGESPAVKLYEDDDILAFLDIRPLNHGHALVIPKTHYVDFLTVPDDIMQNFFTVIRDVSSAVKQELDADGINIISNIGKAAGQAVYHSHFHIIPRYKKDRFRFKPEFAEYKENEMEQYGEAIKRGLNINKEI